MAVAINSSGIAGFSSVASQRTLTFTNTAGTYLEATAWVADASDAITSMTCTKGATDSAMTKIDSVAGVGDVSSVSVWRITTPDTGSITIKANYTGTKTVAVTADSWTGAQYDTGQTVIKGTYDFTDLTSRAVSQTTIADNSFQRLSIVCNSDQPMASTNTTDIQGTASGIATVRSSIAKTPAGSGTLNVTFAGSPRQAWVMSSIAPSAQALTMVASTGAFTLTGVNTALSKGYVMVAGLGSFILTGINAVLSATGTHWARTTKSASSFSRTAKSATSFSRGSKSSTSWNRSSKH